jgi:hypothetical protein
LVALVEEDGHIEAGIVCPRSEHAVVEIESVHLCPNDVPVDLLPDGPTAGADVGEAALECRKFSMLNGHRTSGIIRNAVAEIGPLKRSPFGKEFRQIRKRGFLLLCPGCNRGAEKRKGEEKSQLP